MFLLILLNDQKPQWWRIQTTLALIYCLNMFETFENVFETLHQPTVFRSAVEMKLTFICREKHWHHDTPPKLTPSEISCFYKAIREDDSFSFKLCVNVRSDHRISLALLKSYWYEMSCSLVWLCCMNLTSTCVWLCYLAVVWVCSLVRCVPYCRIRHSARGLS